MVRLAQLCRLLLVLANLMFLFAKHMKFLADFERFQLVSVQRCKIQRGISGFIWESYVMFGALGKD